MKIIDEKGRLFGKINIIDLAVIIFAISLIPTYFSFKRVVKEKKAVEEARIHKIEEEKNSVIAANPPATPKYVYIEAVCDLIQLPEAVIGLVQKGDRGIDDKGKETAEVIWVGESRPFVWSYSLGKDENERQRKLKFSDPELKNLIVKLRLRAQVKGNDLYYNAEPLRVQLPFTFVTGKYSAKAGLVEVHNAYE